MRFPQAAKLGVGSDLTDDMVPTLRLVHHGDTWPSSVRRRDMRLEDLV
jgi:hypothetical protein